MTIAHTIVIVSTIHLFLRSSTLSRARFTRWKGLFLHVSYHQSLNDYILFIFSTTSGRVFILMYVNDILITCVTIKVSKASSIFFSNYFKWRNLVLLHHFLVWKSLIKISFRYFFSKRKYIHNVIEVIRLIDDKIVDTPLELNVSFKTHRCVTWLI